MRRMITMTVGALALALATVLPQAPADAGQSLRGNLDIPSVNAAPELPQLELDKAKHPRSFKEQPPLIPHKVAKYETSLRANECLECHDKSTYKKEDAPMAGESHYIWRDGKNHNDKIARSRWFCRQCHDPQTETTPLVENTFQGVK